MGVGKDHAKFTPGILFYRNASEIILDKELESEIKKTFPNNEIKIKGNKISVKDDKEKSILDFCEGLAQKNKKEVEVKDTDEIVFTIESFGQMKAEEILKKSIDVFKKELKHISKVVK